MWTKWPDLGAASFRREVLTLGDLDFLSFRADFSSPRIIAAYDELSLWSAMFGLLLLDEVSLSNVRKALDVGCGTGFPLIELAERLGPGKRSTASTSGQAGFSGVARKSKLVRRLTFTSTRRALNRCHLLTKPST